MPKFKLLLNENIGSKVTKFLRRRKYDVKSTIENFKGVSDKRLLEIAVKQDRIIVTLDQDFCRLVFRDSLACRGIILLRLKNESPANISKLLGLFLDNTKEDLKDKFVVVTENRVRMRLIKNLSRA